jgi:hypothetical protein
LNFTKELFGKSQELSDRSQIHLPHVANVPLNVVNRTIFQLFKIKMFLTKIGKIGIVNFVHTFFVKNVLRNMILNVNRVKLFMVNS